MCDSQAPPWVKPHPQTQPRPRPRQPKLHFPPPPTVPSKLASAMSLETLPLEENAVQVAPLWSASSSEELGGGNPGWSRVRRQPSTIEDSLNNLLDALGGTTTDEDATGPDENDHVKKPAGPSVLRNGRAKPSRRHDGQEDDWSDPTPYGTLTSPRRLEGSATSPLDSPRSPLSPGGSEAREPAEPTPAPAPTPAHYISSARARSGGGSGSPEKQDPLARLVRFLRAFYRELAAREAAAHPLPWAPPLPPATLCPARFQPQLQLIVPTGLAAADMVHEPIGLEHVFAPVRTSDGVVQEAPRRVLLTGHAGSGKTTLALRLLHDWATAQDGPWWPGGPAIQLALFVPLRELRGSSLVHYIGKELLPKTAFGPSAHTAQTFSSLWKGLEQLEDRLLFVLDGYDEAISTSSATNLTNPSPGCLGPDIWPLLDGRLFPEARVLITSVASARALADLNAVIQRRIVLSGLARDHVENLVSDYFGNRQTAEADRLLDMVHASPQVLAPVACAPLGWLLLCVLYEDLDGQLPESTLDLHQSLFKCMIRRSLSCRGQSPPVTAEVPGHCKKLLAEFGRLALACVKQDRYQYTDQELRTYCRGNGASSSGSGVLDVSDLGFLTRGLTFGRGGSGGSTATGNGSITDRKRKSEHYTLLLPTFAEFLAAYYISSVVHYANILRRELELLPPRGEPSTVLILRFLMGLLGRKAHLVLDKLCPLDYPVRTLFGLLQSAGPGEANAAAVCRLVGAGAPGGGGGGAGSPAPLVHTSPLELDGWAQMLRSESCALESLELVFQLDKGSECEPLLDQFFSALAANDSVRNVRVSSLLGHEFTLSEVARLASYVRLTLAKPRLHGFELVITCLEDGAHDRFQSLVEALCESLSRGKTSPSLSKLVLDLNLGTSQVVQVCEALRHAAHVTVLHLPHLGCGREGLRAVAGLVRARPLVALNLAGSWGTRRDDPPSSSGVSVGSGSGGSSGGVSTLQHPATTPGGGISRPGASLSSSSVSPKASSSSYSYFSSLPRGVLAPGYNSLSRPATLPRQPLQQILDGYGSYGSAGTSGCSADGKRNSDSVLFQRLFHPLPSCDPHAHAGSGFHDVFEAVREPGCKLRSLNVSKCLLGVEDAVCLGETVRKSQCLDALRLEGGTRLAEVLPVLLGLADNTSLQLLDLSSQRLVLDDGPAQLVCQAVAKNATLRLLSLDGWTFRIEEEASLPVFLTFLQKTSVRDLVLTNCRLHLTFHDGRLARLGRHDDSAAELLLSLPDFSCPSVIFLRLGGFQVTVNERLALRGPHLLPFLKGFTHLSDLDLSLDKASGSSGGSGAGRIGPISGSGLIDDKALVTFFQTLASSFRTLQSLRISHWHIRLEEADRTLRQVGRSLKTCSLSYLRANGLIVSDGTRGAPLEHLFLQTAVANLSYLSWLSFVGISLTPGQAATLGKCIRDRFPGTALELSAKDCGGADALKALVAALEDGGKLEVTYHGGRACNLRIQRLLKGDRKLKGKFRRFTSLKE